MAEDIGVRRHDDTAGSGRLLCPATMLGEHLGRLGSRATRRTPWVLVSFTTKPSGPFTRPRAIVMRDEACSMSDQRSASSSLRLAPVAAATQRKVAKAGSASSARANNRTSSEGAGRADIGAGIRGTCALWAGLVRIQPHRTACSSAR